MSLAGTLRIHVLVPNPCLNSLLFIPFDLHRLLVLKTLFSLDLVNLWEILLSSAGHVASVPDHLALDFLLTTNW